MPKRIVLACFGSYGDLFPSLGLARRLKALGHTPVVATSPFYRNLVEAEGAVFHAVRPDIDPGDTGLLAKLMDPARGSEAVVRDVVVPNVGDAYADLTEAVRGADLLVSHPITFAAPIVADVSGLPWLSTVLAPISMFSAYDFPATPPHPAFTGLARGRPWLGRLLGRAARRATASWSAPVLALRRELGVPSDRNPLFEGQFSPHGTLALFSSAIGAPQPDWPVKTTETGFVFFDDPAPPAADLAAFLDAGDPPIVFTLGTSAAGAAGSFYEESVGAVTRLGKRAVLLVGRDPRNRPRHPPPGDVLAVEYTPHAALFARAAAVVHHGGVGTMAQGLRAGVPALVVPHAHDQFDNARRAEALGVARAVEARRYDAARAASALGVMLWDAAYADRARAVGVRVRAERGAERACDVILALAACSK